MLNAFKAKLLFGAPTNAPTMQINGLTGCIYANSLNTGFYGATWSNFTTVFVQAIKFLN